MAHADAAGGGIELLLLGPFEVRSGGGAVAVGGAKPRALLADLALRLGEVVSADRLIDDLWGDAAPETAAHAVQVYVSQLRKALGPELIVRRPAGYQLELERERSDLHRFARLAEEGRDALGTGDAEAAAAAFRSALALRRGPPLADFTYEPFAQVEIARLEELHQSCLEGRIAADLALGRHDELVPELEALVAAEPLRERLRAQLMLALYRSGRQADALAAYQAARRLLLDELGIEPGPELRQLEAAILRQDETLAATAAAATPAAPTVPATRRLVTVLFAGLDATTLPESLDPEAADGVLEQCAESIAAVTERHGGTAAELPGRGTMAVFGIPSAHEDDALRGARAALELRAALARLGRSVGVELRCGIGLESGEVLARPGRALTGEPVAVAARLQQLALPGEVVVGGHAGRLLAHASRLEPLATPALRGGGPDTAFRLLNLDPTAPAIERRLDAPLVGRGRELTLLREAFDRACATRSPEAVLLVGPAGIGKSRLASELARTASEARVLSGRCLSYGEGITYWPLRAGVLESLGADGRKAILALLAGEDDADAVAAALATLATGEDAPSAGEIAWAFRRLLETVARAQPLVLVLDDLHWAEPSLLDLVEHLAGQSRDAPMLIACLAREELLEARPGFLDGRRIPLDVLSPDETDALAGRLLAGRVVGDEARAGLVATAGGNPLFLEQLLALVADGAAGPGRELPATIRAVLAARLEAIGPGERAVLERAAIVGQEFEEAELVALLEPAAAGTVPRHLDALTARCFLRDASSFRHGLIQEAVYRAMPKEHRARLHEAFADWLDRNEAAPELDELVGYHLERAYRLRVELGPADRSARQLATDAGRRLGEAGMRAWRRSDAHAAVNLLGRAAALLPAGDPARLELLCELGIALRAAGEAEPSEATLREAAERASEIHDGRIELRARLELGYAQLLGGRRDAAWLLDLAATAIPTFETLGDDRALGRAWLLAGFVQGGVHSHHAAWQDAAERALLHYRRVRFPTAACLGELGAALYYGPTPVPAAIARCRELLAGDAVDRVGQANLLVFVAGLEAMHGRFDEARALVERATASYIELGQTALAATYGGAVAADVELLAGDPAAADRRLAEVCRLHEQMHNWSALSTRGADRAEALFQLGRLDEAELWAGVAEARAQTDDLTVQPLWRGVRAKLLAKRGAREQAEALANEAVALADRTDALNLRAKVRLDLAEVLRAERPAEADAALAEAVALYVRKANLAAAERARSSAGPRVPA